ncbi:ribonuclease III [Schlesneria paludicola]|uniref:ribonuclease III n=1 Tax=Schlesneria paludicola TaxID=360056 RepID=UPI0002FA2777|nr:ribonuclease III [Schlesneria paludicola]
MSETLGTSRLEDTLSACEQALGYQFRDRTLLKRCLTHSSIARTRLDSNERLEFLGDAILGTIVCELLFLRYPEKTEGDLTRIKSVVVSRTTCAKLSTDLKLGDFLQLGKGLSEFDKIPLSIQAAVFESIVAGLYLDGGMDVVRPFLTRLIEPEIDRTVESAHGRNYKSLLQQLVQKNQRGTPLYQLLDECGPDHSKCFKIAAVVGIDAFPPAWGPNKKEAEQRAAENAWCLLQGETPPFDAEDGPYQLP